MSKLTVNVEEQSVSGDIRTKDGQIINVKVEVPSDGSLWGEELTVRVPKAETVKPRSIKVQAK